MKKEKKTRRAWEHKRIEQAKFSEEAIRLCRQYTYELHNRENKRKEATRFRELEKRNIMN